MKSILFVEDEDVFYPLFSMLASRFSFNSIVSKNIKDAKKELSNNKIELVVIDYELPDGKGDELNRYIKENYPDILTALSSGHGDILKSRFDYDYVVDKSDIVNFIKKISQE
ncbi:MAG: hypothetical protein LDL13_03200 [Calditerrivibrio sp.]|nr:hypothetical protein [Calditerrivibrio sp.]MCA1932567.1 hypothetical protein [Calditerrivibrio sp.]MCA1980345.1 hypothetical protein [Calditerrivibrio sp.]